MQRFLEGIIVHFGLCLVVLIGSGLVFFELRRDSLLVAEPLATAAASEQRMRRAVKPRITIVSNKCPLDTAQRIWQVIHLSAPGKPQAGMLIPFADVTAFYDGKEWWCSEVKR